MEIQILLPDIRSAHNVGSIFRTADAAGVSKIFLAGVTPTPIDRFGRPQREIAKTALGAQQSLNWEYAADPVSVIERCRGEGFSIVAVEQDSRSDDYRIFHYPERLLLILGGEVDGVPESILDACDSIIEIPMLGAKESLNVAVAAGIILFRARG